MRRRAPRRSVGLLAAGLLATGLVALAPLAPMARAQAQAGVSSEGALFLLLPVGARAVATGGAVAGITEGSESLWWNPASAARQTRGEVAIHHAQTISATSDALAVVVPRRGLAVFAVAAHLVDLGEQEIVPPEGPPAIGTLLPRNVVVSASVARAVTRWLDLGVTYKLFQIRSDCSGQCANVPVDATTSSAADVGARVRLGGRVPLELGLALRNVGPDLELAEGRGRDPLPTRWQAGLGYAVPGLERYARDVSVRLGADLVTDRELGVESYRVGTEAIWQQRVMLRGGYVFDAGPGTAQDGPTVGLGLAAGRLVVDIAREFQGLSVDAGRPPTYVSLRFRF